MVTEAMERKQYVEHRNDNILTIRNLSVFYGSNEAVKNVSLPIEKNKITALIGPSGCGKSTFLRTINRMNDLIPEATSKGEILYDGINLLDPAIDVDSLRKEIGMVFQKANPFQKPILNNITYALKFYGIKNKKKQMEIVEESLRKAALWDEVHDRLESSALSLSGGQQQRLCIARTLALKPKVLLLDEPASALDPISNAKIESLLLELKKDHTIVIVTHNMQQASRISDKTAFFLNGDLVEYDDTDTLFTNPKEKKTEQYISGSFG